MVFKVCGVDTLSLVYFQMGTAQITLLSSDVWHKQLQIMGCWGERDSFFSFFALQLNVFRKQPNTEDISLQASLLTEFCSDQTSRVLHSLFTDMLQLIWLQCVPGTKHLAQPLIC